MSNIVFLEQLDDIIRARIDAADASSSYTAQLASAGITRVAQKVGEEGVEVAIAAAARDDDAALLGEAADLIYHLAVLLALRGLTLDDAAAVLADRHR